MPRGDAWCRGLDTVNICDLCGKDCKFYGIDTSECIDFVPIVKKEA